MSYFSNYINLGLLLVCLALYAEAEKVMRPNFKQTKFWSDNKHVTHTVTYDAADPHINFTLNVLQDVHDVDIHSELRITQKADPTYFFAFNSTVNLCRILAWRAESPVGTLIHAYLKEYGNILETCPIAKGEYYMHKFWHPEDPGSAHIPEMDFELHYQAYAIDTNKQRTLIIDDYISGEAVVTDVANIKRGILAMLPKSG